MAEINPEWGRCFRELLNRHNLTFRGAMMKAGGVVSHTTIKDWADGIVPRDHRKAWAFFAVFPGDEAAVCLRAANLPLRETDDPREAVRVALNKYRDKLSAETIARLEQVVEEVLAEELRKQDKEGG